MRLDLTRDQIARHNPTGATVNHQQVEHFRARVHLHLALADLPFERLISAEQQLLTGLATGIEGARNLRSTERAIIQITRIFTRKWNALRHTLIDNVETDL